VGGLATRRPGGPAVTRPAAVHFALAAPPELAVLALPLLAAAARDERRSWTVSAPPAPRDVLAAAGWEDRLSPPPPSPAIVVDLRPGVPGGRVRRAEGPRSEPYWRQCFRAAEEAGLGVAEPPPRPWAAHPATIRSEPSVILVDEKTSFWPCDATGRLEAVAAERRCRLEELGAGGPSLDRLRQARLVVTGSVLVLAWSAAAGTACVAVLGLRAEPLYHLPARGPATVVTRLRQGPGRRCCVEVAAAAADLLDGLPAGTPRVLFMTEEQED
jgi:hypothetical protein